MPRIVPSLAALLLCSSALSGCETVSGVSPFTAKTTSDKTALEKQVHEAPAADLAGGVRQAHDLRLAGKYDEASRVLSQLMLVASDDPRVVGEYGKTLLQRGRSQDAVQFLSRAVEIQSGDWTTYSALGVAYDQLGNQASARDAYEHALALQPREASVLSNYALSRMLANDLDGARVLAARAESAGGSADPKIARTIAMIVAAAPQQPVAMQSTPVSPVASAAPAPQNIVASAAPAPVHAAAISAPTGAPHALIPATVANNTLPAGTQPVGGVVMQAVPVDPLAGPTQNAKTVPAKTVASAASVHHAIKAVPVKHNLAKPAFPVLRAPETVAKTDTVKPTADKIATVTPAAPAADKAKAVADKAATPVKAAAVVPLAKPAVDKAATPVKAVAATVPAIDKTPAPVKAVAAAILVKPVGDKAAAPMKAAAVTATAKAGDKIEPVKAAAAAVPVKTAAAAPAKGQAVSDKTPAAVKAVASKQDGVPALRLAADASTP